MADKGEKDQRPDKNENSHEPTPNSNESLESFITEQYAQQKDEGRMTATAELCDDRTANFFARAISESRRMDAEVQKSNRKLDALHKEFGMELVNSWQAEHASEVLQPHEAELVRRANYQS